MLNKDAVAGALYERLRTLFAFAPDRVLSAWTSTYFAGPGPPALAKHGYRRAGQPRNVPLVVGVLMVAGWPIAHHVWAGHTRPSTTVKAVRADLRPRFRFRRIVFVGERGLVTARKRAALQAHDGHGFLVGMTRRQKPAAAALLDGVEAAKWLDCPRGLTVHAQQDPPRPRLHEVPCDRAGVRVLVVNLPREKKYAGTYLLQTDQTAMTPAEAVAYYKALSAVERGLRSLKDPLGLRPMWHQVARRVPAPIFVAALAFVSERMLERALKDAGRTLAAQAALPAVPTIRAVHCRVGGEGRSGVTPGSSPARQVLKALGRSAPQPPAPPAGEETTLS